MYPACVIAFELALHRGHLRFDPWGIPLLAWGYLQYRVVGNFRRRYGGGGPGTAVPPERIVTAGPYRYVRNPMYLGHLIFTLGLAVAFRSWFALALFVVLAVWFHGRVLADEAHLSTMFGAEYTDYQARVKRWIPGVF